VERVRKLASSGSSEPLRPHGLLIDFAERRGVEWSIDPKTGKPRRSKARTSRVEIDACARCHSRRSQLTETDRAGSPLLDHYLPTLLADGLYHADGQVADEVYVYGSFLQSRMAQAGVTCSDCHEPHSGELRAPGDQVCGQCHALERYAAKVHHHHAPGSGAAACTSCHMPATTFMEVDVRRDHGFRIPSAALSSAVGSPDVCTDCHLGRTQSWAAITLQQWAGSDSAGYQRFGPALFAAREGSAHARPLLAELLRDEQQPSIARATALQLLAGHLDEAGLALVERALGHADPMLRFGALEALRTVPLSVAWPLASPLLADPILAVRIQAARQLAPALAGELPPEQATALRAVIDEYVSVQRVNGERPESHVNLATLYTELGEPVDAEAEYRRALVLQDQFVPAYVNLADLLSRRGQEDDADALLRTGMQRVPDSADLNHALGLSLVRQKRLEEALTALQRASALAPENSRYAYVQAVALDSSGDTRQAIAVLEAVHARASGDVAVLQALVSYQRKVGNIQAAQVYEQRLARLTRASGGTGRAGR
jgi:Tfp pilus assembly protein PilF